MDNHVREMNRFKTELLSATLKYARFSVMVAMTRLLCESRILLHRVVENVRT
jgi:hypothetical protein